MKKEAIRVSSMVPTAPTTLYLDWLQSDQHGSMTGTTAKVDPQVGGKFTALNGTVSGKLIVLDLGRRLVMSWRSSAFPKDAVDSRVELTLEAIGGSSRVTVLQTDIPEGLGQACKQLWEERYFAPMRSFFSKYLPDPRKPPPPRPPAPVTLDDDDEHDDALEEVARPRGLKANKSSVPAKGRAKEKPLAKPAPAKAAPARAEPKKIATKNVAPKKPAPKKSAPAKAAPKKAAPRKAAPKKPAPKKAAPKKR